MEVVNCRYSKHQMNRKHNNCWDLESKKKLLSAVALTSVAQGGVVYHPGVVKSNIRIITVYGTCGKEWFFSANAL